MINYLLPITIACLFLPFKTQFGPVQVRPFDGMVVLMFLMSLRHMGVLLRSKLSSGLLILIPFFVVHVLSAYSYSATNGLREFLQVTLLFMLAFLINCYADKLDCRKAGKVLLVCMLAIMAYNIGWHIEQGFWIGWKRLLDPKALFTFLPMLIGVQLLLSSTREERRNYWVLWALMSIPILLSGERKGVVVYVLLTVAMAGRGRIALMAPIAGVALAGLVIFAGIIQNQYLATQLDTLLSPAPSNLSLAEIAAGYRPESVSNASRRFQLSESANLISQHPIFGVGTNAYVDLVAERFGAIPKYLKTAVHNEFLRILVENGLVGLLAYVAIWLAGIARLGRVLKNLRRIGYIGAERALLLFFTILMPPFFYVALEASGTRVMMAGVAVSLIPWLIRSQAILSLRARANEAPDEQPSSSNMAGIVMPSI